MDPKTVQTSGQPIPANRTGSDPVDRTFLPFRAALHQHQAEQRKKHLAALLVATAAATCSTLAKADDTQYWLNTGAISAHDQGHHNALNYGLGVEVRTSPDWGFTAGQYRNSEFKITHYAAAIYTPLQIGPVHLGAMAGAVDGYPANDGHVMPAAAAIASMRFETFAVTASFIPHIESLKNANTLSLIFTWRIK